MFKLIAVLFCLTFLSSCAHQRSEIDVAKFNGSENKFNLKARFALSIYHDNKITENQQGRILWEEKNNQGVLTFLNPLGGVEAEITYKPDMAMLKGNNRQVIKYADNINDLVRVVLQKETNISFSQLPAFIQGHVCRDKTVTNNCQLDEQGRPQRLDMRTTGRDKKVVEWWVQYNYDNIHSKQAKKLDVRQISGNENIHIRLIIEKLFN